jgi:hypothetical protein
MAMMAEKNRLHQEKCGYGPDASTKSNNQMPSGLDMPLLGNNGLDLSRTSIGEAATGIPSWLKEATKLFGFIAGPDDLHASAVIDGNKPQRAVDFGAPRTTDGRHLMPIGAMPSGIARRVGSWTVLRR